MDLGSYFYLESSNGKMFINSTSNIYRGSDLTTKGGVFYIFGFLPVLFTDNGSIFECKYLIWFY